MWILAAGLAGPADFEEAVKVGNSRVAAAVGAVEHRAIEDVAGEGVPAAEEADPAPARVLHGQGLPGQGLVVERAHLLPHVGMLPGINERGPKLLGRRRLRKRLALQGLIDPGEDVVVAGAVPRLDAGLGGPTRLDARAREQVERHVPVLVGAGVVQRRPAVRVAHVDVRARVEEQVAEPALAEQSGVVEGRVEHAVAELKVRQAAVQHLVEEALGHLVGHRERRLVRALVRDLEALLLRLPGVAKDEVVQRAVVLRVGHGHGNAALHHELLHEHVLVPGGRGQGCATLLALRVLVLDKPRGRRRVRHEGPGGVEGEGRELAVERRVLEGGVGEEVHGPDLPARALSGTPRAG
mmetsp:Transcript_12323/g.33762  ORF Transcript_12323/g.33762 Transcript_12323/m.33762 type:complete len:353 (+) Transcript_12323:587-1645(+)